MEIEKVNTAFISKMGRGRNPTLNPNESIRTKRSISGTSPRSNSPKKNHLNQAEWFEKYIIEKTKNERLASRLLKSNNSLLKNIVDENIDLEKIYQEDPDIEDEEQTTKYL